MSGYCKHGTSDNAFHCASCANEYEANRAELAAIRERHDAIAQDALVDAGDCDAGCCSECTPTKENE